MWHSVDSYDLADSGDFVAALTAFLSEWMEKNPEKRDEASAWRGAVDVGIVLSSALCRYLVVPWSDAFLKKETRAAYLRAEFTTAYGDSARDWEFVSQDADYDRPTAACAIDASLLRTLREACARMDLKLIFCRPLLSVIFDSFVPSLNEKDGIFALVEKDVIALMAWANDEILDIDVEVFEEGNWTTALDGWAERMRLTEGGDLDAFKVFILCPSWARRKEIPGAERPEWIFLDESGEDRMAFLPERKASVPVDTLWELWEQCFNPRPAGWTTKHGIPTGVSFR